MALSILLCKKSHKDLPIKEARYPGEKDYSKPQELRAVINLNYLNQFIDCPHHMPMPELRQILRKLEPSTVATILDISAAFYSIEVDDDVKPLLCFQVDNTVYNYARLPMGLSISTSLLQHCAINIKKTKIIFTTLKFTVTTLFYTPKQQRV